MDYLSIKWELGWKEGQGSIQYATLIVIYRNDEKSSKFQVIIPKSKIQVKKLIFVLKKHKVDFISQL